MKILITGGLGNLGSWITEHLLDSGFEVTTFSSRDRDVLRERAFERVFGEVENERDLERLFSGKSSSWDAVIHLASVNEADEPNYPQRALAVNALGTRNLLQALAGNGGNGGGRAAHFIYFSTFHVYGLSAGEVREDAAFPSPKNDYASTHLFAEYYVKQFYSSHKIPFTIFRLTNSYGCPKQLNNSKWYLVLNDLARTAAEQKIIKLSSNGRPRRDFVWMKDVCSAVEKCVRKGAANDVFNLGGGASVTMSEVAETVKKAYEDLYSLPIEIQKNESDTKRHDEAPLLRVSISKLQAWIDFEPQNKLYEEATAILKLLAARR